ncbi:HIT domain protein [Paraliobacillus sp. PM-2]|uniref:HIT family protein n=1 Tax=Paraliobacillus sp. PM-2 TaxID=1462524 RepID=UPI00061C132D|nr:HIT domain-containing protein [Paraliobacillus sp. PM-2]CQR46823.1 HIT domain protein [Paraliobacillus sp. PM-2]
MEQKICTLCEIKETINQHILFENETCMYIQKESEQEVLEGSGLIIPKAHKLNVFQLSREEWMDTQELLNNAKDFVDEQYAPDGYTIGWNSGEIGGQSIPHAHLHVIPRFKDEPYAKRGIRYWIKQDANQRKK